MEEFRLAEASLETGGFRIAFKRRSATKTVSIESVAVEDSGSSDGYSEAEQPDEVEVPKGIPITSPMNGIFYVSPSPSSPPFVREGEPVSAGQIVGLIEAMKVFNEIPSTVSGTVIKLVAETGAMVQPGDVLLYVG